MTFRGKTMISSHRLLTTRVAKAVLTTLVGVQVLLNLGTRGSLNLKKIKSQTHKSKLKLEEIHLTKICQLCQMTKLLGLNATILQAIRQVDSFNHQDSHRDRLCQEASLTSLGPVLHPVLLRLDLIILWKISKNHPHLDFKMKN